MPSDTTEILIEYEDVNEHTLFSAKPIYIDDTNEKFEEILQSAYSPDASSTTVNVTDKTYDEPVSPHNLSTDASYISSSSLEDSIKIYNVQTGEIVKSKPEDNVSRYETDDSGGTDAPDNDVPGENVDSVSEDGELSEQTLIVDEGSEEGAVERVSELEEILPQLPRVKELAKRFVSMENVNEPVKVPQPSPPVQPPRRRGSRDTTLAGARSERPERPERLERPERPERAAKLTYMHSLTARSISKEFRDELKLSMATPLKVPGGSKEIPEGAEDVIKESSRPGSPVPEPGTIKTKLAFFESLKSKFSTK